MKYKEKKHEQVSGNVGSSQKIYLSPLGWRWVAQTMRRARSSSSVPALSLSAQSALNFPSKSQIANPMPLPGSPIILKHTNIGDHRRKRRIIQSSFYRIEKLMDQNINKDSIRIEHTKKPSQPKQKRIYRIHFRLPRPKNFSRSSRVVQSAMFETAKITNAHSLTDKILLTQKMGNYKAVHLNRHKAIIRKQMNSKLPKSVVGSTSTSTCHTVFGSSG
jgi:hypothetical protein